MIVTRDVGLPPGGHFYCRRNQHLVTAGLLAALVSGIALLWAACWRWSGEPALERRLGGQGERVLPQQAQTQPGTSPGAKRAR